MTDMREWFGQKFGEVHGKLDDLPLVIRKASAAAEYERMRTKKMIRLPILSGKAVAGALTLGGDTGEQLITPAEGYIWAVRELNVEGLTASASAPDTVNFFRNQNTQGKIFWQLNGNVFCQTFGWGEKILFPGDNLLVVSVGTFAATGTIAVSGLANEIAAERMGELF